jgi:universal stress protein A
MSIRTIACFTDFSDHADKAVAAATDLARRYQAALFVVHVLPPVVNPVLTEAEWIPPEEVPRETFLTEIRERMQDRYGQASSEGLSIEFVVLDGHVSTEILTFLDQRGVDLAVMGSYGLSGMGLVLFGSVTKRVSQKANCSVMIVRDPA